ncbi:MAG: hypothetical protein ACLGH6_02295 [Gammaproteobacteria bacterium]
MPPSFSRRPGAHERQLIRCADNPLFPPERRHVIQVEVNRAQRLDAEEAVAFQDEFRSLVQRASELRPQEDSEVILKLKEELDRAYERCCGLPDAPVEIKTALRKLLEIVMRAVWRGAGDDAEAQVNLREEEAARAAHFQLLEQPLIADLIRPDSPIGPDELVPTLLSESETAVSAALELFDADQLTLMCQDARTRLDSLPPDAAVRTMAQARLHQLERHLAVLQGHPV